MTTQLSREVKADYLPGVARETEGVSTLRKSTYVVIFLPFRIRESTRRVIEYV